MPEFAQQAAARGSVTARGVDAAEDLTIESALRLGWRLLRTNLVRVIALALIMPVIGLLLVPLLMPLLSRLGPSVAWLGELAAAMVGQLLVFPLFFAALAASFLGRELDGEPLSFKHCLGLGLRSWARVGLIQLVVGVVALLPLVLGFLVLRSTGFSIAKVVLFIFVGIPVLLVPSAMFSAAYCLSPVAAVAENAGVFVAMGQSAEMTRGHRMLICIALFVAALILAVAQWIAGKVLGVVAVPLALASVGLLTALHAPQSILVTLASAGVLEWLLYELAFAGNVAILVAIFLRSRGEPLAEPPDQSSDPAPSPPARVPAPRPPIAAAGIDPRAAPAAFEWTADLIRTLDWRVFRQFCAALWQAKSYRAELLSGGAEKFDFALYRPSDPSRMLAVVQCKANSIGKIGLAAVQQLAGLMQSSGAPMGILMTTSEFQDAALEFARGKHIKLLNGEALLAEIRAVAPELQQQLIETTLFSGAAGPTCSRCGVKIVKRQRVTDNSVYWLCRNHTQCAQV